MVKSRRGTSKVGCLLSLLLTVTAVYFAVDFGEVYFRSYRYQDAIEQEARFASQRSDDAIVRRLAATADSLGLPEEAARVRVLRNGPRVSISAEYTERVTLPFFSRDLRFTPSADNDQ